MIEFGSFKSHSGLKLPWKINCDTFNSDDWNSLARLIGDTLIFYDVYGVPTGGSSLAKALRSYCNTDRKYPTLIVDDVMTTGNSMLEAKKKYPNSIGFVIFDRSEYKQNWIYSLFKVNKMFDA